MKFHPEFARFSKFVLANGSTAGLTLLARAFFNFLFPFELSVVLAHLVGMTAAFALNKFFVFETGDGVVGQYSRYALVNLMSLALTTSVSALCYRLALPALGIGFYPALLSHLLGLGSTAVPSYLAHKHFSFGASSRSRRVSV